MRQQKNASLNPSLRFGVDIAHCATVYKAYISLGKRSDTSNGIRLFWYKDNGVGAAPGSLAPACDTHEVRAVFFCYKDDGVGAAPGSLAPACDGHA